VGGVAASATSSLASASGASLSAPVASASASAVPSYDFTCPSNTSLTYNIASMTYPQYTFSQAVPAFFNWTQALYVVSFSPISDLKRVSLLRGNTHFLNTTGSFVSICCQPDTTEACSSDRIIETLQAAPELLSPLM